MSIAQSDAFYYQDYTNNEIDAFIELDDTSWCGFEIKLVLIKLMKRRKILLKSITK